LGSFKKFRRAEEIVGGAGRNDHFCLFHTHCTRESTRETQNPGTTKCTHGSQVTNDSDGHPRQSTTRSDSFMFFDFVSLLGFLLPYL